MTVLKVRSSCKAFSKEGSKHVKAPWIPSSVSNAWNATRGGQCVKNKAMQPRLASHGGYHPAQRQTQG